MSDPYILSYRYIGKDVDITGTAFFRLKAFPTFIEAQRYAERHPMFNNSKYYFYIRTDEHILWSHSLGLGSIDHRFNTLQDKLRDLILHYNPEISQEKLADLTNLASKMELEEPF